MQEKQKLGASDDASCERYPCSLGEQQPEGWAGGLLGASGVIRLVEVMKKEATPISLVRCPQMQRKMPLSVFSMQ